MYKELQKITILIISILVLSFNSSCNKDDENEGIKEEDKKTWYVDKDLDGYGDPDISLSMLAVNKPVGFVADNTDCDDTDDTINPNVSDSPYDGIDSNCDNVQEKVITTFSKTYGGSATESGNSIVLTKDGGYVFAGTTSSVNGDITSSKGSFDFWIVKIDSFGKLIWKKSFGGSNEEIPNSIQQTTDGGYVIVGHSFSTDGDVSKNNGGKDLWVIKIDAEGNLIWEKSFGGSRDDSFGYIQQTSDNGYIIAGRTNSVDGDVKENKGQFDCWVIKLNAIGNLEWERTYGGSLHDTSGSIIQTTDGGYIIAANVSSTDGDVIGNDKLDTNTWVFKTDSSGVIIWQKIFGGSGNENIQSIKKTNDEGYVIVGSTYSQDGDVSGTNGESDFWIIKIDNSGNLIWNRTYGGSKIDAAYSVVQNSQGNYIIAGVTQSTDGDVNGFLGNRDGWIINLDSSGNLAKQRTFGGTDFDLFLDIKLTPDGGYIAIGNSSSNNGDIPKHQGGGDIWVLKLNPDEDL